MLNKILLFSILIIMTSACTSDAIECGEFYNLAKYEETILCVNEKLATESDRIELLKLRGNAYYKIKKYKEALSDFLKVYKKNSKSIELNLLIAECYFYGDSLTSYERYENMQKYISIVLKKDQINAAANYYQGRIKYFYGKYDSAIFYFTKAIKNTNSKCVEYSIFMASANLKVKNYNAAYGYLKAIQDSAQADYKADFPHMMMQSEIPAKTGKEIVYDDRYMSEQFSAYTFYALGIMSYYKGKEKTALNYYNKAISLDSVNSSFYSTSGIPS